MSETAAFAGLDWQAFSAAYYPGRRRHDFEALIAYGVYRRSLVAHEPVDETARALGAWEDEGGPAP